MSLGKSELWMGVWLLAAWSCQPPHGAPVVRGASRDGATGPARTVSTEGRPSGIRWIERDASAPGNALPLPLVIAIHGLGDTPEAFLALFDGFGTRARVVALRGLDAWGDGWSWFDIGRGPASAAFARAVEASADRVALAIAEISRARPTCGRTVIMGFSQGGMLSYTLAARHPELHALFIPIAGRLGETTPIVPGPRDIEVHAEHGTTDPRVPFTDAQSAIERLSSAHLTARLEQYPGVGHTISDAMRRDLFRWIDDAVTRSCPQ